MGLWDIDKIPYVGREKGPQEGLAFHYYDADKVVAGKKMKDWLRFGVAWWHTFDQELVDPFGTGTAQRPWYGKYSDPEDEALAKVDYAFEFFQKLGVEYFCFHDRDIAPEGDTLRETDKNLDKVVDKIEENMKSTGIKLLWNTSSLFTNPRFVSGASTSPFADIYAYAGGQLKHSLEIAKRLGAENYVFWGGREGYETLLNTDLRQEREQIGRFMQLVVEHKHKTGFQGTLLIEPKPQEPTKHQYDYDAATVYGFLKQFGLEKEIKLNIEANHATLAGHSFHHEIATAIALGLFGSVDANRGDAQLGWDTDQFPNSVEENALVMYEILKAGGFTTGGLNFDAKVRRQSTDKYDLFYGHIGAMDTMALSLKVAARMIEDGELDKRVARRYAGWNGELGQQILNGQMTLSDIAQYAAQHQLAPQHRSGQQEQLENLVNHYLFDK